jgi:hypothetical protein
MCVRRLIPAAVTECQLLTVQSSSSDFWPKGLALFFFPSGFSFGHAKEKSDTPTIKKHSKEEN